jgi:two-component sensor histidine kinase
MRVPGNTLTFAMLNQTRPHNQPMKKQLFIPVFLFVFFCLNACKKPGDKVLHASQKALADSLSKKATAYYQTTIDSIFFYADSAYRIATEQDWPLQKAHAAVPLAEYQRRKGDYSKALEFNMEARTIYEKEGLRKLEADAMLQTSVLYKELGGEKKTREFLEKGLAECRSAGVIYRILADTLGLVNTNSNKGIIYRDISKINDSLRTIYADSALQVFQYALMLDDRSHKATEQLGKLYNNISQIYYENLKDYPTALNYLHKAVAFNKQRNNVISLTHNYGNLSEVYVRTKKLDSALYFGRESISLSKNMPHRLVNAYGQMFRVEKARGRLDSAIVWQERNYALYDSITNLKKTEQLAQVETQTRYKTKEKEANIAALNKANSSKNRSIAWLTAVLGLVALLMALLYRQFRRSQQQKREIAAQSHRLELMMKELHHRVKNNLQIVSSLLSLQTYRVQDEKALQAIKESRERVQAMSLIHQRLYKTDQITAVNIREYLTDLAEQLVSGYGYGPDQFTLNISVSDDLLDVDKALPLGLIANEVITNALKYAYHNHAHPVLHISLNNSAEALQLSIGDNGPGMDVSAWNSHSNRSFGKQLIGALGKQIRAQQHIDTTDGTRFTFTIPKAA